MKRIIFAICCPVFLLLALLTGCGDTKEDSPDDGSRQVSAGIKAEKQSVSVPSEADADWELLSMQFHGDETVQFWGKKNSEDNTDVSWDIYLFRGDGEGELLFAQAPRQYRNPWFLDADENLYLLSGGILRLDREGNTLWHWKDGIVRDICQLADQKIMLLVDADKKLKLAELNPETGEAAVNSRLSLGEDQSQCIGAGAEGLLLLNREGFWQADTANGSLLLTMPFAGSTYVFSTVSDFREREDGRLELLRGRELETLELADIRENRTAVRVAMPNFTDRLKYWAEEFNRSSENYYVILEDLGDENDLEFQTRINLELAAGRGPDVIGSKVTLGDVNGAIEKGLLENLAPYMEKSGIREEDYFPCAFDCWRDGDKIYAVEFAVSHSPGFCVQEDVLGDCEDPDIEAFVDALYRYPEQETVFFDLRSPKWILDFVYFRGTEDLWGMIDWEKGTCDLDGGP